MNLIVGGTGSLGSALARRLLAANKPVRIMTRTPKKAADLQGLGAEVIRGDLLHKPSLVRACEGVTSVVASAHSVFGRGQNASKYVDMQGHKDLIDAAVGAGVDHFVYISVYDLGPEFESVTFLKCKREVERHLKASELGHTILRPTFFMESYAGTLTLQPILEQGKGTVYGEGENPRNMVAADDVAHFAALALHDPGMKNQTIDVGGLDNVAIMDVVRLYERLSGRPANVSHVPRAMLNVMYRVLRPFNPGLSQIMQMSIYGDTVDCTYDAGPLLAKHRIEPTRLEDWVSDYIRSEVFSVAVA